MAGEPGAGAPTPVPGIDAAVTHPWAFVFMAILMLSFGVARIAKETTIKSVKWKSLLHFWTLAYLVVLGFLMSVTTAMSLVLLIDEKGQPRVGFIPESFVSLAAAVLGVFGFEFLFRKFIIGFGENKIDFAETLQSLVDQAVQATAKKDAG
jgi:hypothetical protein